ncbi:MAG: carboxypeptidase-like regulatory domain-containing protein, partial [Methylocella sp.]
MRQFPLVATLIAVAAASPIGRGTWQGLVFDASGVPVAGAHVQAGDIMKPSAGLLYQAYSDANGHFIISGVPAGATTVQFWAGKPESFFPDFPGSFYTDRPPAVVRTLADGLAQGVH